VRPKRLLLVVLEFCGLFVVLAGILYAVANHEALLARLTYWWQGRGGSQVVLSTDELLHLAESGEVTGDRIVIPKLDVAAPLVDVQSSEPADVLAALERGVVRYPGTAEPGATGMTFLTGHSSNYAWSTGGYRAVFALIDKLEPGDPIVLVRGGGTYVYRVSGSRVVSAQDGSALDVPDGTTLRLMTCWPVGTTAQRLLVEAVYQPDESRSR